MKRFDFKRVSALVTGITLIGVLGFTYIRDKTVEGVVEEETTFKIAEKKGHSGKTKEKFSFDGNEINIDRLIYDNKFIELEISYKQKEEDSDFIDLFPEKLLINHGGSKEEVGGFGEISVDKGSVIYKMSYSLPNELVKGDTVSLLFQNEEELEELEVELSDKILDKKARNYLINENIDIGEVDVELKELNIYPLHGYMDVVGKSNNEKWSFESLGNNYLKDYRGNIYKTYRTMFLEGEGDGRRVIYNSPYYKSDRDLELFIEGVYIKNNTRSTISIENSENYNSDSEYDIDIRNVETDNKGRIRGFKIAYNDERLSKNKWSNNCFQVFELWVGDEKLEKDKTYKVNHTLEVNEGIEMPSVLVRIDILAEGDVRMELGDFLEYREVNKTFKIKEGSR